MRSPNECAKCGRPTQGKPKDLTGLRFGRLTVKGRASNSDKESCWLCECDCGELCVASRDLLIYGRKRSCGCLRREVTGAKNRIVDPAQVILSLVDKSSQTGCWLWTGYKTGGRYAGLHAMGETKAHRVSYRVFVGEIPTGVVVCHKCDNPLCVNPDHLFLGTQRQNVEDMDSRGRRRPAIGSRNRNARLTENDVAAIRRRFASGEHYRKLMLEYGMKSHSGFYAMVSGRTWRHVDAKGSR